VVIRAEAKARSHTQGSSFLAKPITIPELINAIEEHFPVRAASHVSLPKERSSRDPEVAPQNPTDAQWRLSRLVRTWDMKIKRIIRLIVAITSVALSPITWAAGYGGGYAATQAMSSNGQWNRAPARLIIRRIADLGNTVYVDLWVDGAPVAIIGYGQTYEGFLPPGRHVVSVLSTPNPKWPVPSQMILDVRSGQTYNFTADGDGSGHLIVAAPGTLQRVRYR
jgi:hypothetical protein